MKKFLEVLVDDEGNYHISTDYVFLDEIENPPQDSKDVMSECDKYLRQTIKGVTEAMWRDKNNNISKAIRYLSMSEVISCAEPYDEAENFWFSMMFGFIPSYEEYSTKLKRPYGYDSSKMIRPISWVSPDFMKKPHS